MSSCYNDHLLNLSQIMSFHCSKPTNTPFHLFDSKSQFLTKVHSPFQICPASPHPPSPTCPSKVLSLAHCAPATLASSLLHQRMGLTLGTNIGPGKLPPSNSHCSPLLIINICAQMSLSHDAY